MAEDVPTQDLSEDTRQAQDAQPEGLRVDSLAQVLGTTSERVLEALTALDGRPRTAESAVADDEAQRVRQALAERPDEPTDPEPADTSEATDGDEPESRLILETPVAETPERAEYMPLFVAPQPVEFDYDAGADAHSDDDDDDDDDGDGQDTEDDQSERPSGRRRRRGRRGRGRGRGEQNGDDSDTDGDDSQGSDQDDESDDSDEDTGDDENTGADGATRRRRRRRRRKSGSGDDSDGGGSPDDPPNTVVHEREPRKSTRGDKSAQSGDGEIQGISGSTRLEAKRQRRRDGRDAGRRRPPILSEAEFLARREAVERMMVVRDKVRTEPPHEGARYTQIAVLEDGVVVEHFVTSAASASLVGNI